MSINIGERCVGCTACVSICPAKCIEMKRNHEGFAYPYVDQNGCIECGACERSCPVLNEDNLSGNKIQACYTAYANSENIRKNSSSGGIFTLLASEVLKRGGVVVGARFDSKMSVIHDCIENQEELLLLRGSKYVQSDLCGVFPLVQRFLKDGRMVLFSGTLCQIGGLKTYLQKEYHTLICVDIVCHGVPSPLLWEKYLNYCERVLKAPVVKSRFRDKSTGWKDYSVIYCAQNGRKIKQRAYDNYYMRAFLSDLYLRPSCYACNFKGLERCSDITLADCWGIHDIEPKFDDDKGVSVVLVNSSKGQDILDNVINDMNLLELDIQSVVQKNPAIIKPSDKPEKRELFISDVITERFDVIVKKYAPIPIQLAIKLRISRILIVLGKMLKGRK